jgi:hypothetical protein
MPDSNVRQLPIRNGDTDTVTVAALLREAARMLEEGELSATGALLLFVDESEVPGESSEFETRWLKTGKQFATHIQTLGWLDFFRSHFNLDMRT